MKRSIGVTLAAFATLIGSGVWLIFATIVMLATTVGVQARPGTIWPAVLLFVALFVWGTATSFGLFKLYHWARTSVVAFSLLLTIACSLTFFIYDMVAGHPPGMSQAEVGRARTFMFSLLSFGLLVGAGFLWFFLQPSVAQQFRVNLKGVAARRPIAVTLIALVLFLGTIGMPLAILNNSPASLLGMLITGAPAQILYIFFGLIQLWIAWGLLQLNPTARWAGIAYFVYAMINSFILSATTGWRNQIEAAGQSPQATQAGSTLVTFFLWIGVGLAVLPIIVLVLTRPVFEPAGPPPSEAPTEFVETAPKLPAPPEEHEQKQSETMGSEFDSSTSGHRPEGEENPPDNPRA